MQGPLPGLRRGGGRLRHGAGTLSSVPAATMRRCLLALPALLALAGPAAAKPATPAPGAVPFTVTAAPIERFRIRSDERRFGALEFRGGLELSGDSRNFGGISGLSLDARGERFVAVSDAGLWVTGRFVERDGRLAGVEDTAIGPILGTDGKALMLTGGGDTESVAMDGSGTAYVGIEGVNEIRAFPFGRDGLMARGAPVPLPAAAKTLPSNRGFEAIGIAPAATPIAGALIAISERSSDTGPTTRGFLVGGPAPGEFAVRRTDGFDVTDLAFLPGGDLLILERRFSLLRGVAMRLRRIAIADVKPGAVLDGPVLMEAERGEQIDNMEALAVSRGDKGETILTVMSDDNYNFFQRTLVLRFALVED